MRTRTSSPSSAPGAISRYCSRNRTASAARPLDSAQFARSKAPEGWLTSVALRSPSALHRLDLGVVLALLWVLAGRFVLRDAGETGGAAGASEESASTSKVESSSPPASS